MSTVAARLEARAATVGTSGVKQENATVASSNHAEASSFLQAFEENKRLLENELSALAVEKEQSIKAGTEDATLEGLKAKLAGLNGKLVELQQSTATAAHLLTAYDLRSTKIQLGSVEEALARMADTVAPKKRFAFKKKTAPSTAAASALAAASAPAMVAASSSIVEQLPPEDPLTGFYRKDGLVLVKVGSVTEKDVMLTNLKNCVVFILDRPSALRCHNLVGCHIYAGPCSGSVLIYGATDCTFHLAARQLRIHDTHRTTFHLHALSSPIIEHSDTSGFTAYDFGYPALSADLAQSGFEGKPSRHATVEDFNWLRSQQSPNWYAIMPEGNKRAPVHLTQQQVDQLKDMSDDQPVDEATQKTLKQLAQELKIIHA